LPDSPDGMGPKHPCVRPVTALIAALLALAETARAAPINHFEAAAGPHNYLVTNHPAVLPHLTPSAWLILSYAHDPLVYRDADGNQLDRIIEHQVNAEVAAAFGLFDRFEIAAVAPGMWVNGPGLDGAGVNEFSTGDLRVLGKVLLTPWNEGLVASFRLQSALLPVAQLNRNAGAFAGETFPNITPALTVGFSSTYFKAGADVGYLLRAPTQIDPSFVVGHEITYGVGMEIAALPKVLAITGDVYGRATPSFLFSSRDQFPLEGAVALKGFLGPVALVAGIGSGIIADYGSPDVRVFAGIGFYPQADGDRDGDGILDSVDKCPDDPEDKDGYADEDGCPDPDNDADAILDVDDKCPNEPEDKDRWQDEDGCPDPDNDEDELLDDDDECPNDPETKNGFEDEDGCPDDPNKKVIVVTREKIDINDKIYFAYDSDRILPRSYELLDQVAAIILEHTEIPGIFIEGHTDADGSDEYNRDLSDRRAKSVRAYLVDKGVPAERLQAKGFGESQPIADNATEEGKAQNRRVEFKIVDAEPAEEEAPAAEPAPEPAPEPEPAGDVP
jgi:large repetitive protein